MVSFKTFLAAATALSGLAHGSAVRPLAKKDICIDTSGGFLKIYITTNTVSVPSIFQTSVLTNGPVNIGGTTIIINNAPTSIQTVIYTPSVQTMSQTATVTNGPNGQQVQVGPVINIVNFPVYISTFVQQNTIINNGGATIVINNAPTTIITTATGTSTVTATSTSTVTNTLSPAATPILLQANVATVKRFARRQNTGGFLTQSGQLSQSCSGGISLAINNGRLVVPNTALAYTANVNDTSILFAPSANLGTIQTTWNTFGGLSWLNSAFTNGAGVFYAQNGQVRIQLQGTAPGGLITFTAVDASRCQNGQIVNPSSTTTTVSTTSTTTTTTTATSPVGATTTSPGATTTTSPGATTTTSPLNILPTTTTSPLNILPTTTTSPLNILSTTTTSPLNILPTTTTSPGATTTTSPGATTTTTTKPATTTTTTSGLTTTTSGQTTTTTAPVTTTTTTTVAVTTTTTATTTTTSGV